MLDQSFSAKNLRRILDFENRKGIHVEDKVSMSAIRRLNQKIKDFNVQIKIAKRHGVEEALKFLNEQKKILRDSKETELSRELERISQRIVSKGFSIELKKVIIPGGKPIYTSTNSPENFFALKQLQWNISRLFGVKQANRNSIVEQVISLLGDSFPKYVIRTDINNFYESIPHTKLFDRIDNDNLLTPFSRAVLRQIINSYKSKSGSDKGVPRGIGVSAYLAELFMRDFDRDIQDLKGVTYYARYVDDIIIIFTPSPTESDRDFLKEIKDLVENNYQIKLNPSKTNFFDLRNRGIIHSFSYLGYKITFGTGLIKTNLSFSKVEKYRLRIKLAFDDYLNLAKINEKSARKLLIKRIRFLSGNTRLANNKKNILVGVYYSNRYLTQAGDFNGIDKYLTWQIDHRITSLNLRDRLRKYKFRIGYQEKRFSPFTSSELSQIMKVWK